MDIIRVSLVLETLLRMFSALQSYQVTKFIISILRLLWCKNILATEQTV